MLNETLRYLGIAFACSAVLIVLSKIILQNLIRRPADYYDAAEIYQEKLMLSDIGLSMTSEHLTDPEGVNMVRTEEEQTGNEGSEISEDVTDSSENESRAEEAESGDAVTDTGEIESRIEEAEPVEAAADAADAEGHGGSDEGSEAAGPASEEQPGNDEGCPAEDHAEDHEEIKRLLIIAYEEQERAAIPLTSSGRPRKPSMSMKKAELTAIAEAMEIDIPDGATKRIILDLIKANMEEE